MSNARTLYDDANAFIVLPRADKRLLGFVPTEWASFAGLWAKLEPDRYLRDGGDYRRRGFGRFLLSLQTRNLKPLAGTDFYQTKKNNPENGGYVRHLPPLPQGAAEHPDLHNLIRLATSVLPPSEPLTETSNWEIGIHMFRVIARSEQPGKPTPEGVHRDGHAYVAQFLINKWDITGGVSSIYDSERRTLAQIKLHDPLDFILLDDRRVLHCVTPIFNAKGDCGARDTLILDFNISNCPFNPITQ